MESSECDDVRSQVEDKMGAVGPTLRMNMLVTVPLLQLA
jgi:hypothetical protein